MNLYIFKENKWPKIQVLRIITAKFWRIIKIEQTKKSHPVS